MERGTGTPRRIPTLKEKRLTFGFGDDTVYLMGRRPLIGITCSFKDLDPKREKPTPLPFDMLKQSYSQAVWKAGGIPVILPNLADEQFAIEAAVRLDGVVFSGGEDVGPERYGEKLIAGKDVSVSLGRDKFEFNFFAQVYRRQIPILGICRGHQFINVALGGTLYQDLTLVPKKIFEHESDWRYGTSHPVELDKDSRLAEVLKTVGVDGSTVLTINCNTNHHQVLNRVGKGLKVVGVCLPDGIVEACEGMDGRPLITVQWHPEMMLEQPAGEELFRWIVNEAKGARPVHQPAVA
jgi:putative glutamine amidotransferase